MQEQVFKRNNIAFFANIARNYSVEIVGMRYPKDFLTDSCVEIDNLHQYRELKVFYRQYVDEKILSPSQFYPDLQVFYPIQVLDLSLQGGEINP